MTFVFPLVQLGVMGKDVLFDGFDIHKIHKIHKIHVIRGDDWGWWF
jgi:hypothetical protein